jgi:hypothetical protein
MPFWKRKPKHISEPELSREDMEELVDESIKFAKIYASDGSVSGMEMALQDAVKYGRKIGRSFDSIEIAKIKLMGYELGEKVMLKREAELRKAGRFNEAQNALNLAELYGTEAKLLKKTI